MYTTVHYQAALSVRCCYPGAASGAGRSGDGVAEGADAGDLDADDVAGLEVERRGAAGADAGGGAGQDQVAGAQRGELGDRRDQPGDRENQQVDARVLYLLAVDGGGDPLLGDVQLVRGDQGRAE